MGQIRKLCVRHLASIVKQVITEFIWYKVYVLYFVIFTRKFVFKCHVKENKNLYLWIKFVSNEDCLWLTYRIAISNVYNLSFNSNTNFNTLATLFLWEKANHKANKNVSGYNYFSNFDIYTTLLSD